MMRHRTAARDPPPPMEGIEFPEVKGVLSIGVGGVWAGKGDICLDFFLELHITVRRTVCMCVGIHLQLNSFYFILLSWKLLS